MDSREFAKTLHAIKCNSIASQFSEKTNTEIVKAEMEIDNLILIKNQNKIYSHSIASNVAPDRVHKLEGVRMNEEAFMKAVQIEKLEVYSPESINKFNADISKAFDLGRAKQEDIEKAKKDISKLTKVQVTGKDGVLRTVYVKRGEEPAGKTKPSGEGKKTESSTPEKLKTWDDKTLRKYRDDIKSRISDIQDQLRRDQEDGTRTKESSKKAADEITKHEKNLKLVRSEIEARKTPKDSEDKKEDKVRVTIQSYPASIEFEDFSEEYRNKFANLLGVKSLKDLKIVNVNNIDEIYDLVEDTGLDFKKIKDHSDKFDGDVSWGSVQEWDFKGIKVLTQQDASPLGIFIKKEDLTKFKELATGKKIEKAESNTPSSKEESKEHTKTYKELKEDAMDSKLDTTKKEFGKKIRRDHEAE